MAATLTYQPKFKYFAGTGRRKSSVATVKLIPGGSGKVTINGIAPEEHFSLSNLIDVILAPLAAAGVLDKFDVIITVYGGGYSGQAGAIRLAIARALLLANADFREVLKKAGYLTRDSRMKERKKYGLRGARKKPQFSKR